MLGLRKKREEGHLGGVACVNQHASGRAGRNHAPAELLNHPDCLEQIGRRSACATESIHLSDHWLKLQVHGGKPATELPLKPPRGCCRSLIKQASTCEKERAGAVGDQPRSLLPLCLEPAT